MAVNAGDDDLHHVSDYDYNYGHALRLPSYALGGHSAQDYAADEYHREGDRNSESESDAAETMPITAGGACFLGIDQSRKSCTSTQAIRESDALTLAQLRESWTNAILDLYAASCILFLHLITVETLLCMAVSVVATTAYYLYGSPHHSGNDNGKDGDAFSANLSWTIVSFAVVAPLIMQIKQAFARREVALTALAEVRALLVNIFLAMAIWNWGDNGRKVLPPDFADRTRTILQNLVASNSKLLQLPTVTRGRHRFTARGRRLALSYSARTHDLQMEIVDALQHLHQQVEILKANGLPANEASRINQYHWLLQARLERLQNIKFYRTPQGTRSFTRLFILVLPFFYGPYYVYVLRSDARHHTNFAFALTLSVVTTLTMMGLFNVEIAMEDPFVGHGLDGIRLKEMLSHASVMIDRCHSRLRHKTATRISHPSVSTHDEHC